MPYKTKCRKAATAILASAGSRPTARPGDVLTTAWKEWRASRLTVAATRNQRAESNTALLYNRLPVGDYTATSSAGFFMVRWSGSLACSTVYVQLVLGRKKGWGGWGGGGGHVLPLYHLVGEFSTNPFQAPWEREPKEAFLLALFLLGKGAFLESVFCVLCVARLLSGVECISGCNVRGARPVLCVAACTVLYLT